jgi:hypothetical protein
MRKLPWYIYLIVVLVIGYSIALYMKPQETDWSPTLSNKDKIPYGSYVLFHELDTLMGYQPDMLRITPYEQCGDTSYIPNGEVYMFISPVTPFDKGDVNDGNRGRLSLHVEFTPSSIRIKKKPRANRNRPKS